MKKEKNYVLVSKLSKDIDDLEKRLKHVNIENFKKISIRNIKIFGRVLQMLYPYILAFTIPFTLQSIIFDIPFYPENVRQEKCYMMELDNKGIIDYQSQYDSFSNESNRLYIYSKWEKSNDYYTRTINLYRLNDFTNDELIELVNKDSLSIVELLGSPVSSITEKKNILTEEEIKDDGYIKAKYYYEDKDDYIIIRQSIGENLVCSLLFLFIMGMSEYAVFKYRSDYSSFYFQDRVDDLIERYEKTDVKMLEKKLEVKKNNLYRLQGDKHE